MVPDQRAGLWIGLVVVGGLLLAAVLWGRHEAADCRGNGGEYVGWGKCVAPLRSP